MGGNEKTSTETLGISGEGDQLTPNVCMATWVRRQASFPCCSASRFSNDVRWKVGAEMAIVCEVPKSENRHANVAQQPSQIDAASQPDQIRYCPPLAEPSQYKLQRPRGTRGIVTHCSTLFSTFSRIFCISKAAHLVLYFFFTSPSRNREWSLPFLNQ